MLILERDILYSQWKMGIDRSLGWEPLPETNGKLLAINLSNEITLVNFNHRYIYIFLLQMIQKIYIKLLHLEYL